MSIKHLLSLSLSVGDTLGCAGAVRPRVACERAGVCPCAAPQRDPALVGLGLGLGLGQRAGNPV